MNNSIHVKAFAYFENNQRVFLFKFQDTKTGEYIYRPIGGTVEFGELSEEALHREILEELNTKITIDSKPIVLESIFSFENKKGHEVVFVFPCSFKEQCYYEIKDYQILESNGEKLVANWYLKSDFLLGVKRLVPEGLTKRLKLEQH
ncbi:MAG: NUDIX domain-containing protein [Chitinophagales bacterium]|nr:NUDIX domain-containing protein [Chitinophagales bacterium]